MSAKANFLSALSFLLLSVIPLLGQQASPSAPASAMVGRWAGYLEYRDYSESPASTKRVQLPTWLEITQDGDGLLLHYTYDDGPGKVVESKEHVSFDVLHNTYTEVEPGHPARVYQLSGYPDLKEGRGTLTLTGEGTDNGRPSENRVVLIIRRNLLEWTEETRLAGSKDPFVFRHLLRVTRTEVPAVTPPR